MRTAPTDAADVAESNDESLVRAARRRERRKARSDRAYWWSTKLHALLWVAGAVSAFFMANFFRVATQSTSVNLPAYWLGVGLLGLELAAVVRMSFWFKAGEAEGEFESQHPKFLLAASVGGLVCFVALTVAFWPVYRIFTPFLLALFWLGAVMSFHFLP